VWFFADTGFFGLSAETINAISQLGFTGGAVLLIGLMLAGKIVAGYLLDRAEARADKLQVALDAAAAVNSAFPKVIADLNVTHSTEVEKINDSHEREMTQIATELRRLQDMMQVRP
jgi:hypothetical protein